MLLRRLAQAKALQPLLGSYRGAWQAAGHLFSSLSDSSDDERSSAAAAAGSSSTSDCEELGPEEAAWLEQLQRDAAAADSLDPADLAQLDEALGLAAPDRNAADVPPEDQKLLQAGVVGAPNAGKSTLVNRLVNAKVSAVSPKTNTTEQSRLGAFTFGDSQVVLYDTPGVVDQQHYRNPAHQRRVRSAWTVAGDCDLLLFLVDASRQLQRPDPRIHRLLAESCSARALGMGEGWSPPPAVLVLNKVDLVPRGARPQLLPLSDHLRKLRSFEDVFYISAKDGRGVPELRQFLLDRATQGEWTLEAGMATDRGEEEQALETVREQLFLRLYKELPYSVRLRLTSCLPQRDGSVKVEMDVLVHSEAVKKIVVGAGGAQIAAIRSAAQAELQEAWGHPVHLFLRVRVEKVA